jgi:hypothetical protein
MAGLVLICVGNGAEASKFHPDLSGEHLRPGFNPGRGGFMHRTSRFRDEQELAEGVSVGSMMVAGGGTAPISIGGAVIHIQGRPKTPATGPHSSPLKKRRIC